MLARGYALVPVGFASADEAPDSSLPAAILRKWGPGITLRGTGIPEIAVTPCAAAVAAALDAGAADAVAVPVDAHELAARLDARIRHHAPHPIVIGDLRIDPVRRHVTRADHTIPLLPREYALLLHLAERRGECVSRRALLAAVWQLRFDPGTNVVAVHMSKLRAKLDRGFAFPLLHTVKGVGYRLDTD
nr:winged helix-turn-helix domain-containing protein [Sphingomonas tagetis]